VTLVSTINTDLLVLLMIGELLPHRLISQFRRAFKRNDRVCQRILLSRCQTYTTFLSRRFAILRLHSSHTSSIKASPTCCMLLKSSFFSWSGLLTILSKSPLVSYAKSELSSRKTQQSQRNGLYTFPFRIKRVQVSVIASRK